MSTKNKLITENKSNKKNVKNEKIEEKPEEKKIIEEVKEEKEDEFSLKFVYTEAMLHERLRLQNLAFEKSILILK